MRLHQLNTTLCIIPYCKGDDGQSRWQPVFGRRISVKDGLRTPPTLSSRAAVGWMLAAPIG
jgi:hypothetical protein